jgi:hypothetical protein
MKRLLVALGLMLAPPAELMTSVPQAAAQSAIKIERVAFRPGQSSTTIIRTIRGRETIDFLVNGRQGQRLVVSMLSNNQAAYFNLIAPGEQNVAFYTGEMGSPFNSFSGVVPRSGDLKIRVYLYRAAARRGESARINLRISVTDQGGVATQLPGVVPPGGGHATHLPGAVPPGGGNATHLPGDALVPGSNYHATTILPCAFDGGVPARRCSAGVRRRAGPAGETYVEIERPGRPRRIIFFRGTEAFGADGSQADGSAGWNFEAIRSGDDTEIVLGLERYIIADAFVIGG